MYNVEYLPCLYFQYILEWKMTEISKSDLGIIEERLPVVIDQFENFNHIGSGTFSKVYVANIKVGFNLNIT